MVRDKAEIGPDAVTEDGEPTPTTIAHGVRTGALACVARDCSIGPGTELAGMVGLADGVRPGAEAMLMGQAHKPRTTGPRTGEENVTARASGRGRLPTGTG